MKLFLALLISYSLGQERIPSFPTDKLRQDIDLKLKINNAKKVVEIRYDFEKDSVVDRLFTPKEYIFNKNGELQIINVLNQTIDTPVISIEVDKYGRIVSQKRFDDFLKYEYNDRKRTSKEFHYYKDSTLIELIVVIYDSKNRIIKKETYRKEQLSHYSIYEYNDKGDQISKTQIYTPNGPGVTLDSSITGGEPKITPWPNDTTKYEYSYGDTLIVNEIGGKKKIEKITKQFHHNDTLTFQEFKYEYSSKKFEKRFERKEIRNVRVEEYTIYSHYGCNKFTSVYMDNVIQSSTSCNATEIYQYLNTTDNNGNWTSKTTLVNNKKRKQIERIIGYW